ncbi:hypothetical protein QJS10_CPA01g01862 [Acorus calamus]|uniref:Uncharacterized protein n=1 Tax=Acorus calamus TaxID=4465 RepID=A0AAV9FKS6_ACOCL|nr:hypothetical protein QJS10_CPA01g01862 [Acorus calamus]
MLNKALLSKWLCRWDVNSDVAQRRLLSEHYGRRSVGRMHFPWLSRRMSQMAKGMFRLTQEFGNSVRWTVGDESSLDRGSMWKTFGKTSWRSSLTGDALWWVPEEFGSQTEGYILNPDSCLLG